MEIRIQLSWKSRRIGEGRRSACDDDLERGTGVPQSADARTHCSHNFLAFADVSDLIEAVEYKKDRGYLPNSLKIGHRKLSATGPLTNESSQKRV
jgi:hypothetical protein